MYFTFICRPLDAEADDKLIERELELETPGEDNDEAVAEDDKKDEAEGGDDKEDDKGK